MPTPITPADKFRLAQQLASEVAPMWAPVIKQWEPKPVWGSKKLTVKGREIKFDSMMPVEQLAAEIIHATDHFVMGHKPRREERDKHQWQTAACLETIKRWDAAIKAAGLEWAPGSDLRDQFPDIKRDEAENLYKEVQAQESEGEGQGDPGEGNDLGDDDGEGEGQEGEGKPGQGKPGQGKPGQGKPGQGQPGQGQPGQGQPGDKQKGEGQPGKGEPGDGDGVCRLDENEYDDSMLDELDQDGPGQDGDGEEGEEGDEGDGDGKKPGQKPGPPGKKPGEQELARQKEEAFLSLARKIVQRLLAGSDKRDYSLSKPSNRSYMTNGAILSSLNQKPRKVGIIIDVSGSVDDKMRNAIFRVAEKVQHAVGNDNRITVALGDTEVKDVGPMRRVFENARGGGGTAMEVVIPEAVRRMRSCDLFLIITDGETAWPDRLPANALVLIVNDTNPNMGHSGWYNIPPHVKRKMMWVTKSDLMKGGDVRPKSFDVNGKMIETLPSPASTAGGFGI